MFSRNIFCFLMDNIKREGGKDGQIKKGGKNEDSKNGDRPHFLAH
jgi:hypothetical protein